DRAAARVYGPRAMRVFALKADIAKARGDRAGETKALEEALARSEASVLTPGQKAIRESLVKRLAALR
ncbi:MAG: thiol reductase thioredoxin, partial [Myxococcales bacterium]|nr:thiol reductase thioredoxin [Myxococcales bacterium]